MGRLPPVAEGLGREALPLEHVPEQEGEVLVVLDDERLRLAISGVHGPALLATSWGRMPRPTKGAQSPTVGALSGSERPVAVTIITLCHVDAARRRAGGGRAGRDSRQLTGLAARGQDDPRLNPTAGAPRAAPQ
jgi:hypothetical protein